MARIGPWIDKRLIAGDEWDKEIRRRLEEMDIFLFIASATSLVRQTAEAGAEVQEHRGGAVEVRGLGAGEEGPPVIQRVRATQEAKRKKH